ncbi:ABC transporter permease [Streptomyces amritsarensis]|uniref:ABC transporter permease n=1 Tax=Streptomyces amritsarensis TaxID=681158 RepID=A0ABX3FXA2_9ACTN|nr:ABC transporter permease [Streptomyces amritsarensis]OLZ55052.1 ABC transporter permease [Streptomyces amritsarensis]
MTAVAPTVPSATRHPSPAPRLSRWLLRLHRPALCAWAGLVVLLSAALLWLGGPLTDASAAAWEQYNACDGASRCAYDQPSIIRYKEVYSATTFAVLALPFLVAAWAGATLTSRELETGTAQLTWAQSVSPVHWLTATLALPATLVVAGTGLVVTLHHLAWSAGEGRIDTAKSWSDFQTFYAGGPLTVALALLGLVVGVLVGLLLRRSLPALATSVVATGGVFAIVHTALPYLWPSVTQVRNRVQDAPSGAGILVDEGILTSTGARLPNPYCGSDVFPDCRAMYDKLDAVGYYRDFHPLAHYWPLQLVATALTCAIVAVLVFAAYRVLKSRTGGAPRGASTTV